MKHTRRKNIVRHIRSSFNRFLAILFIVALGSGFMAGLAATSPDMLETADSYFDETCWYDIDVKSTVGFSDEDVLCTAELDGIEVLQCARVLDLILDSESSSFTCRVYGILDETGETRINKMHLNEGRMPACHGECVIQTSAGRYTEESLSVGDTLTLSEENENYDTLCETVTADTLTIVGIVESPLSIAVMQEPTNVGSGSIGLHVFTGSDCFDLPYYTDLYLTLKGAANEDSFGDAYQTLSDTCVGRLEDLGEERAPIRAEELRDTAQKQISALEDAVDILESVKALSNELDKDTSIRIEQTKAMAERLKAAGLPESKALSAILDRTAAAAENAGLEDDTDSVLLADTKELLSDAEETLDSIGSGSWMARTRYDSEGFSSYKSNVSKVSALAKIFPVFFFLVALLVALTTMTRLVEENRGEIGTLKALGFSNADILSEYLLYALMSSLIGCILGFAVGFRLFPYAIASAYSMMYTLPPVCLPIRWNIAAWVAPVTIGSILLAAFWACFDEFRSHPAALIQPKAPPAGKRIWLERIPPVWKRLSFSHKVTCRNLFRYKKRLFMTLLGVAGCTSLLVTGFGLRDSIGDIVDKQFNEIYRYELTVVCDGNAEEAAASDEMLSEFLSDESLVSCYLPYYSEDGRVRGEHGSEGTTLCVPGNPERFGDFVSLRERKSGEAIPFSMTGVILTEKLCETLGVGIGDTVTLENTDGIRGDVLVDGITENYLTSFAYLSPETYRTLFEEEPVCDTFLCCYTPEADAHDAVAGALACRSVLYASSSTSLKDTFADSINSINGVVWVLIFAAGLLCMVVLYSLTYVNICERRKELSTIAVLGFHEREVEAYIFRETNVLSFLGSLCGLGIGVWLHSYVVRTVEVEQVMFGRIIYPLSYLYAILISMGFTLIVNEILRRKIRKIDMVEAMKAND